MLPTETSRIDVYRLGPGFTGAVERDDVTPRSRPRSGPPRKPTR
ncbi:hypothetical protein [Nonomuraea aridisoli]|nr:hypothetical protein [Nonomuraea aridisoli]